MRNIFVFPPRTESQKATSTGIYVSELLMLCTARKYDPNPASSIRRALRTSSFQWKMTLSYFCIRRMIDAHFQFASWMDILPQNVELHQQFQVWVDGRELRSPVRVCHSSCPGFRVISGIISCEQDLKSGILATLFSTRHRQVPRFLPESGFEVRIITERF